MKPTVLLDVDGVIANFIDATLELLRRDHRVMCTDDSRNWPCWSMADAIFRQWPKDADCYWGLPPKISVEESTRLLSDVWNSERFATGIRPYEGAIEGVLALMEIADVYFVTSPIWTSKTWTYDRALWLRDHLGIDNRRIIFTSSKHLVHGDIFVDDKPETVEKWRQHNSPAYAVVWDQPYNQGHPELLIRTSDWGTIRRYVELCKDNKMWGY